MFTYQNLAGGGGGPLVSGCPSTAAPHTPGAHPNALQPSCHDFQIGKKKTCLVCAQLVDNRHYTIKLGVMNDISNVNRHACSTDS